MARSFAKLFSHLRCLRIICFMHVYSFNNFSTFAPKLLEKKQTFFLSFYLKYRSYSMMEKFIHF